MTEQTWNFGRTAGWPEGPWTVEPDKVQWVDPATGLDCLILRNRLGALCGYVGLPPEHPWHGNGYDDCDVVVHGGLTFAAPCPAEHKDDGICHVPEPGRPADVWWLGFDTAHYLDLTPLDVKQSVERPESCFAVDRGSRYRDVGYVKAECALLAGQVAAVPA